MKHEVIRTPIDILNILGAGGIKRGSIIQMYGTSQAGKSTFCYQTASYDMMDNEDCVLDIIDVEASTDLIRLSHSFKLDMDRVSIYHFASLEEAFKLILDSTDNIINQKMKYIPKKGNFKLKLLSKENLLSMEDSEFFEYCSQFMAPLPPTLKNDISYTPVPIVPEDYDNDRGRMMKALARAGAYTLPKGRTIYKNIIWDTIAVSRPIAELEKISEGNLEKNAAGMNVHAQVVSSKLSACLSSMGGKPITLFLPNQVRNKANNRGGFDQGSSGSYALEHNCHYILKFRKRKDAESRRENYDEDDKARTGTNFVMEIEKTKFCPATNSVNLYINDKLGGVIVPKRELIDIAKEVGILKKSSGWYTIKGHEDSLGKFREERTPTGRDPYLVGNPEVRKILMEELARHYRSKYNTLNVLYEESGRGDFGRPLNDENDVTQEEDENLLNSMNTRVF